MSEITYAEVKFKNASPAAVVEGKVGYSGLKVRLAIQWRRPGGRGAEEQGMQTLPSVTLVPTCF